MPVSITLLYVKGLCFNSKVIFKYEYFTIHEMIMLQKRYKSYSYVLSRTLQYPQGLFFFFCARKL